MPTVLQKPWPTADFALGQSQTYAGCNSGTIQCYSGTQLESVIWYGLERSAAVPPKCHGSPVRLVASVSRRDFHVHRPVEQKLSVCQTMFALVCGVAFQGEVCPISRVFGQFEHFFPTCQVRVVRFYHSCSPPRLAILLLLLLLLLRQHLLHHLCLHFHVHCCLANSSPSSSPTSELSVHRWIPAQCAPLDLNLGPAQLSVHRWTSLFAKLFANVRAQCAPLDLNLGPSSSVCTAGPQPGTCPAQCAPLDLNLGPAQLSVHRWTSTAR